MKALTNSTASGDYFDNKIYFVIKFLFFFVKQTILFFVKFYLKTVEYPFLFSWMKIVI